MRSYACMLQTIDTTKDPFFNRKMHSGVLGVVDLFVVD